MTLRIQPNVVYTNVVKLPSIDAFTIKTAIKALLVLGINALNQTNVQRFIRPTIRYNGEQYRLE